MRRDATMAFRIIFLLVSLGLASSVCGDQVGIDKVRLFEEPGNQYLLEVDTLPKFIAAYREPVLPSRFETIGFERDRQQGYVVLRYRFATSGDPLQVGEELLLPWGRAGASITVQWADGSVYQNLFLRDFEGIRVPVSLLRPVERSTKELVRTNFLRGLKQAGTGWVYWLLAIAVGLFATGGWRIGLILMFAAGHAISLVLAEWGVLVIPGAVAELCVIVVVILIARRAPLDNAGGRAFAPVLLILGVLHGLANAKDLVQADVTESDLVLALAMLHLGIDLVQLVAVGLLIAIGWLLRNVKSERLTTFARFTVGGLACATFLVAVTDGPISRPNGNGQAMQRGQFELPVTQMIAPGMGARPRPPRVMEQPVAAFLTIEPYESRLEVLFRMTNVGDWIDVPTRDGSILIEDQESLKAKLIELVGNRTQVEINEKAVAPTVRRADFVTVETNGIFSRTSPIVEAVDQAVIGVTFVFETDELPGNVDVRWDLFSESVSKVPTTTTDPFGGQQGELSQEAPEMVWTNRWPGYRPPEIKQVSISQLQVPALSMLLVLVAGFVYWRQTRGEPKQTVSLGVVMLLVVASLSYPFIRFGVAAPVASVWKPTSEQAADILDQLLSNVYHAYDIRDEEAIYDRLALTITGEQLTEIYLDTRRSLELENRGGARAKVDDVEILEIHSISNADEGGLAIEVTWTVGGSVTHFGHTHFRRNRYRAVVVIESVDDHWKIRSIDVAEQLREL